MRAFNQSLRVTEWQHVESHGMFVICLLNNVSFYINGGDDREIIVQSEKKQDCQQLPPAWHLSARMFAIGKKFGKDPSV